MNDKKNKPEKDSETENAPKQPSALEWLTAALGALLIVSVLGFTVYRSATKESDPPIFSFEATSIKPSGDKFLVTFKIKNIGDETAAQVLVEGELKRADEMIETSSATITYAPSHSEREGGLVFTENPQNHSLVFKAKGYEKP